MHTRNLTAADAEILREFFVGLSPEDRTFFWDDVTDPAIAAAWAGDARRAPRGAFDPDERMVAFSALLPGSDWSSHVAEIVLIVAPAARRHGLGRGLANGMLIEAVRCGFSKVSVNVGADNSGAIAMFQGIGFQPEALLRDHLRSPGDGELRDIVVLAHLVDDTYSTMLAAGLDEVA